MDATNNIQLAAQNVVEAINLISTQSGSPEHLRQANIIVSTILDSPDFKFMFDIGSYIVINSKQCNSNVHNFGFQLLETAVRIHWKNIKDETRTELKIFLESLLQTQTLDGKITQPLCSITTPRLILNSISKCFCAVIKCDWPNKWPKLMDSLLASKRNLVVIFIFLRLAEDIGVFCEPANNVRRREITQGLNQKMMDIYFYLLDSIESQNSELTKASLDCLTALLNWANFNQDLAAYLCKFIRTKANQDINMCRSACDALIVCIERKHAKPESIDIRTSMFENEVNLASLTSTLNEIHKLSLNDINQERFELEKKLIQLLTHILRYVHIVPPEKPQNLLELYLSMKTLLTHPSIAVSIHAVQFWIKVFTNAPKRPLPSISDDLTASLLLTCAIKLIKNEYDARLYGFEFDCQQDFEVFQNKYRSDACDLCRYLTQQNERICFELVYNSLAKSLQQSNTNLNEWDALASLSSAVCHRLKETNIYASNGVQIVKLLMLSIDQALVQASNIQSCTNGKEASLIPDLISSQLSCVSALHVFLPHWHASNQDLTKEVLRKVILLAFHRPDKTIASSRQLVGANTNLLTNESFLKGFRSLSRHASASFVKICQNYPKYLLSIFNDMKMSVDSLFATATDNPFSSEKGLLYEGLTLIYNEEPNEISRKKFALELFETIKWFQDYELNCEQFIDFVGLDRKEAVSNSSARQNLISQETLPKAQLNRVKLSYVINFLCSLTRRITSRQTLLPELLAFAKPVLNIMHTMHTLWLPEMQQKCHKDYRKVLFAPVSSSYNQQILDSLLVNQKSTKSSEIILSNDDGDNEHESDRRGETQYIDLFSWNFYEQLLVCIGAVISKSSPEFFNYVSTLQMRSALTGVEYLPPLKLHKLTKHFVMPLVGVCSKEQQLVDAHLLPLLGDLLPFLFNQLDSQWKIYIGEDSNETSFNGQNQDLAEEMVRNHLLRNLSKDFIDLMNMILVEKIQITQEKCGGIHTSQSNSDLNSDQIDLYRISNLGLKLLSARPDFVIIVTTSTLTWSDSTLNAKSILVNLHLIKQLISSDLIKTIDEASLLFQNIITSLGMFGEHEQNCSGLIQLFLHLYDGMRNKIDNFTNHMAQMTKIDVEAFIEFDKKTQHTSEKAKRISMRKLLDKLVGKNIGQRYKAGTD